MSSGLDTTFLVEAEVSEHPGHRASRRLLEDLLRGGESLALAPQVLAEFIHIVTDSRRFAHPLSVDRALARAELWWQAREVNHAFPGEESTQVFLRWMSKHRLGRKRLLHTHLAATYYAAGIRTVVTTNIRDYSIFGCFELVRPGKS